MTIDDLAASVNRTVEIINGTELPRQQRKVRDMLAYDMPIPMIADILEISDARVRTIIWKIRQRVETVKP